MGFAAPVTAADISLELKKIAKIVPGGGLSPSDPSRGLFPDIEETTWYSGLEKSEKDVLNFHLKILAASGIRIFADRGKNGNSALGIRIDTTQKAEELLTALALDEGIFSFFEGTRFASITIGDTKPRRIISSVRMDSPFSSKVYKVMRPPGNYLTTLGLYNEFTAPNSWSYYESGHDEFTLLHDLFATRNSFDNADDRCIRVLTTSLLKNNP